jgi:hypothetical protein
MDTNEEIKGAQQDAVKSHKTAEELHKLSAEGHHDAAKQEEKAVAASDK